MARPITFQHDGDTYWAVPLSESYKHGKAKITAINKKGQKRVFIIKPKKNAANT